MFVYNFNHGPILCRFLQEPDLRYLVENIWNSQSVLSAHEDLFDLVLVRWNKYEEWSPWNCILLTKEEASAHAKLENVTEVLVCFCFFKWLVFNGSPFSSPVSNLKTQKNHTRLEA